METKHFNCTRRIIIWRLLALILSSWSVTIALDNGLALTPPMGWNAWERFRCNVDCKDDPGNCISENLFKQMANRMSSDGYRDAGYQYICMDGCWMASNRTADGYLQADPERFPSGIKALAEYVHSKGLKFGIYEDFGTLTCGGQSPGSEFHLQQDAQTFADWKVDYLKFDGCNSDPRDMDRGYPAMGQALNKTGRHILYSCEWPAFQHLNNIQPNYTAVRRTCNTWRNYKDVKDNWDNVAGIINFYKQNEGDFLSFSGPGGWNDPDTVVIGDYGLSPTQEHVQFAMWAMLAAPLLMSNDLRHIRFESKQLLLNRGVISINQDPRGISARFNLTIDCVDIWRRPIVPIGAQAMAFVHMNQSTINCAIPARINIRASDLGLVDSRGYKITEVFNGTLLGFYHPEDNIGPLVVDPTGVYFIKAEPYYVDEMLVPSTRRPVSGSSSLKGLCFFQFRIILIFNLLL